MKWTISSVAVLVVAVLPVAIVAQSGGTMAKGDKMDKMEAQGTTYTGCIEAGGAPGTFTLTHLAAGDHMGKDAMKNDGMKNDAMNKDTLSLMSPSVDLSKHVGHKVSVTGSPAHDKMDTMGKETMGKGAPAFTVKSLKMVATSCS